MQESRILARKLLTGVEVKELRKTTLAENLLQKRSPKSTARMAGLIFSRLSLIDREFLPIIAEGDKREASLLLLAAIAEAHTLVGDFLLYVSRECMARYQKNLTVKDWEMFWEQCVQIQPGLDGWSEETVKKLRSVIFKLLTECGVIEAGTFTLRQLLFPRSVRAYLAMPGKEYARRCMEGLS